jgi:hypothetical protein
MILQPPAPEPSAGGFQGNPNFFAASIDVSGGITVSRTSGSTPCFVHCSASAITAAGSYKNTAGATLTALTTHINNYEDLEFRWTTDDATSETLTNPTDGATVEVNQDQVGAEALLVFRTAGTKIITLTVRARNSDGTGYVTAQATREFVVTDFDSLGFPEFWFDSAANPVGAVGTFDNPWTTAADIKAVVTNNTYRNGLIVNLKRGSTFNVTGSMWAFGSDSGGSKYRWRAYGSGAKPIMQKDYAVGGNTGPFFWNAFSSSTHGNVVSDVDFRMLNSDEQTVIWNCDNATSSGFIKGFFWDNCEFYYEGGPVFTQATAPISMFTNHSDQAVNQTGNGCYKCNFTADGGYIWQLTVVINNFWSFVGCTMTPLNGAQAAQATSVHWIYPHVKNHSMYRWCLFHALPGGFSINGNWDTSGVQDPYMNYFYIGDCAFDGSTGNSDSCATDVGQGADGTANNSGPDTQYRTVVFERNSFYGWEHAKPNQEADAEVIRSRTWRRNRCWDSNGFISCESFNGVYKVYQNLAYSPVGGPNTLISFHDQASFAPSMVTDNIVGYEPSTANLFVWKSADHITLGSFCDRNQWCKYGGAVGDARFGLATGFNDKTFAQWQAQGWDANSSALYLLDPGWPRPVVAWADMGASPT